MRPSKTLYSIKVVGTTICVAPNKKLAEKMMLRLAEYEAWNRRTEIKEKRSNYVVLANYDTIHIEEIQMYHSYKGFLKAMYLEEIPKD